MNSFLIKTVSVLRKEPTAESSNNTVVKSVTPRMIDFEPMQWFEDQPVQLVIKFDHQSLPASIVLK